MVEDKQAEQNSVLDMSKIKAAVEKKLHIGKAQDKKKQISKKYVLTGIPGFDDLFEEGIPKGANIILV
ncbi:MAG: hypothetical protein KAQ84_06155, partial [Thermoplasmatales archaeon]|nr:hypothetical protein [Thermoplasmatales archaeon]